MTKMFGALTGACALAMVLAASPSEAQSPSHPVVNPNGSESVVSPDRSSPEGRGELAMQSGRAWTATNLFKEAVARQNSQLSRFNLAAAYERTGRYKEAARYYQSVIDDGRTSEGASVPNTKIANSKSGPSEVVSESRKRLPLLGKDHGARAMFSNAKRIGGPTQGDVSDAEAARLDDRAVSMPQKRPTHRRAITHPQPKK